MEGNKIHREKTNTFEAMTESIKLFVGIWTKDNMLVLRKVEAINSQTVTSNICIFYFLFSQGM